MNKLPLFVVVLINFVKFSYEADPPVTQIKINRKLENKGFHRYLTTEILVFSAKNSNQQDSFPSIYNSDCRLLLAESFESNFYVDNYELKSNTYKKSFSFILSNKVNTETAEYKARSFNLFLYPNQNIIKCYSNENDKNFTDIVRVYLNNSDEINSTKIVNFCRIFIRLPIHVRYHEPVSKGDYVNFKLRPPNIFATNCGNTKHNKKFKLDNLDFDVLMNSSVFPRTLVFPCQKEVQEREINTLIVQFTNDYLTKTFFHNDESGVDYSTVDADSMCTWEKVKFESLDEYDDIKVSIPIGDTNYELLVLILTLMVVMILTLKLLKFILGKGKAYQNVKSEDQISEN